MPKTIEKPMKLKETHTPTPTTTGGGEGEAQPYKGGAGEADPGDLTIGGGGNLGHIYAIAHLLKLFPALNSSKTKSYASTFWINSSWP